MDKQKTVRSLCNDLWFFYALNQQLVLGRDDFKDKIEEMTNRQTRPKSLVLHRIEEREAGYYFI